MEAVERKGFWDRADLRFGAIDITNANEKRERGRKRRSEKLQIVQIYRPNVEGRPTFLHKEREREGERERASTLNSTRTTHEPYTIREGPFNGALRVRELSPWWVVERRHDGGSLFARQSRLGVNMGQYAEMWRGAIRQYKWTSINFYEMYDHCRLVHFGSKLTSLKIKKIVL